MNKLSASPVKLSASPDVLEAIRMQKRLLKKDIAASQAALSDCARAMVAPVTRIGRNGHRVTWFLSRGMAIFEGVSIGLRLLHATRSLLGWRKRK